MAKYTGTIILGIIALIFGIDTGLSISSHATISEWFYQFLHNDPVTGFGIIFSAFLAFILHVWLFNKKKD